MKAAVERWLTRRWYGGVAPGIGLRSLAGLYRLLSQARAPVVVESLSVPVIVIGNFTAGGTGKTPLVIALAQHLASRGFRPAVVSRGHGRRSKRPVRVSAETPVDICGDEPKLIFERTGLPVFVDSDRVAAARTAIASGCDLIIADDGLQHRRLRRDIEIEVVDGERGYGNGLLLPAGPLRELPRRCDFRVVNGDDGGDLGWPMRLQMGDPVSLSDKSVHRQLATFSGLPVHAVAAIGNPSRFFAALARNGLRVIEHQFPDHHVFQSADFIGMDGPILMTEKDAVKCRGMGLESAWAVPVEATLAAEFFSAVEERLQFADVKS